MSRKHLVVLALSVALGLSAANACESAGPATAIDAVRAQRVAFNEAIAKKDIEAAAATMHDNIILVTGTASEGFTGRAAQLSLWQKDFENPRRGRLCSNDGLRSRIRGLSGRARDRSLAWRARGPGTAIRAGG